MPMPSTLSRRGRRANTEEAPLDGGCQYGARCTRGVLATAQLPGLTVRRVPLKGIGSGLSSVVVPSRAVRAAL